METVFFISCPLIEFSANNVAGKAYYLSFPKASISIATIIMRPTTEIL
jgi:hypothetical protein